MSILDAILGSSNSQFDTSMSTQTDPRRFVVVHCDSKAQARRQQLERSKRNGAITGLDKLAGIEGLGVIQEGLGTLVSAAGVGGNEWENIVGGGVEGILTTVLGPQGSNLVTGTLGKLNPGAVNKGVATAKIILDKVKRNDFNWRDIPQYLSDFKNLYTLGSMVADPYLNGAAQSNNPVVACSASPYAVDLVQQGVKFKFLFVVDIKFHPLYQNLSAVSPAFVVKTADRPTIEYEYEDLNLYNYRTKVIKKASFSPVTFTFHDDEQNSAVAFYNAIMRVMSPIVNNYATGSYGQLGMEYDGAYVPSTGSDAATQGINVYDHAASIGPLMGSAISPIQSINLYHVYNGGQNVNSYSFINPRVMNMALDQLDMSAGETTELKMEFSFDTVQITNNDASILPLSKIDGLGKAKYPLGGNVMQSSDFSSNEIMKSKSTSAGSDAIAEAFSRGESFIGNIASGVTGTISSIGSSIGNIFSSSTTSTDTGSRYSSTEAKLKQIAAEEGITLSTDKLYL